MFCPDQLHQGLVGLCPRTGPTMLPGIIPTALYRQQPAHPLDGELRCMRRDEGVLHAPFREKMLTTFFRISRSSVISVTSRCKRMISRLAAAKSLGSRLAPPVSWLTTWYRFCHLSSIPAVSYTHLRAHETRHD